MSTHITRESRDVAGIQSTRMLNRNANVGHRNVVISWNILRAAAEVCRSSNRAKDLNASS